MTQPGAAPSPLSVRRAFVVQFRADADITQGRCTGRVEHVVSGRATHFHSLVDLLAFIAPVLPCVQEERPDAS